MTTSFIRRMRLGELLVAAGVLDETHLEAALAEQKKWGGKLGRILVDMGFLSEDLMVKALSKQLGIPRVDLDKDELPREVARLLPVNLCERYGLFPVSRDDDTRTFHVATADPTGWEALDEVSFRTGLKVQPVVASASAIDRAIRRYYYGESTVSSDTLDPAAYGLRGSGDAEYDPGGSPRRGPRAHRRRGAGSRPSSSAPSTASSRPSGPWSSSWWIRASSIGTPTWRRSARSSVYRPPAHGTGGPVPGVSCPRRRRPCRRLGVSFAASASWAWVSGARRLTW